MGGWEQLRSTVARSDGAHSLMIKYASVSHLQLNLQLAQQID